MGIRLQTFTTTKKTTGRRFCPAGAPRDPANLWTQSLFGEWSAVRKDALEAKLCRLACDGKVPLEEAQREIATNWITAYQKYIGAHERVAPQTALEAILVSATEKF